MNNYDDINTEYDFDAENIQQTIMQNNYAEAIIACEVERRVAVTYQNLSLSLVAMILALVGFGAGVLLLTATRSVNEPVKIEIKEVN